MKKIWAYLAVFFAGLSAGLIAMYKIMGDTVKVEIKKLRAKKGGSVSVDAQPVIEKKRKQRRKARKNEK